MTVLDSRARWQEIAERAGYFDQAHLIAAFQDLAGLSPRRFAERSALSSEHCVQTAITGAG